jgi:hypothetical protein
MWLKFAPYETFPAFHARILVHFCATSPPLPIMTHVSATSWRYPPFIDSFFFFHYGTFSKGRQCLFQRVMSFVSPSRPGKPEHLTAHFSRAIRKID